jgi:hypothetical protein
MSQSHMQHVQGFWNIDKSYWINFHQVKNDVVQIEQIKRLIDFICWLNYLNIKLILIMENLLGEEQNTPTKSARRQKSVEA